MARKKLQQTSSAIDLDPEDVVHGFYAGARAVQAGSGESARVANLYVFKLLDPLDDHKAGSLVELWGSTVLDDLMAQAEVYAETWVEFKGTKGRTKIYTVEQDAENMQPEKDRQPF